MHDAIKKDLANFPDEVITDWLEPFAISNGWPPTHPRWSGILGRSVDEWRNVFWQKREVDLTSLLYTNKTHDAITGLHEAYNLRQSNPFSTMLGKAGKQRYISALAYIIGHGAFPKPIIILRQGIHHHIVDGNHRFLALRSAIQLEKELLAKSETERLEFEVRLKDKWRVPGISPIAVKQPIWLAEDLSLSTGNDSIVTSRPT